MLDGGSCTVPEAVVTGTGTGHILCTATSPQRGQSNLATLKGGSCTLPEAVVTGTGHILCAATSLQPS